MAKHISIPIENTVELVNVTPYNPLVSKCEIKVCYVDDKEPNRNGSIISKETALKMAASLPGCPIVGHFIKENKDFGGHDKEISVVGGKWFEIDTTKPYGYVDSTAKIWFQKWTDDGVEHEYLMTEGYLWTGVYEEAQSVVVAGKGQSMELHEQTVNGKWAEDDNGWPTFFIINDAMIQKLCILGDDTEPCFEGAGIAAHFSLEEDEVESFKNNLYSMIQDIKQAINEGGSNPVENEKNLLPDDPEFEKKKDPEEEDGKDQGEEKETPAPEKEDPKPEEDEEDEDKKKVKKEHSLTDEEVAASDLYKTLFAQFTDLKATVDALNEEIKPLREFKIAADKKAKQDMIDRFYMLSDEDKKDCIENIDNYSLDQIESKLSIICVRNKVSFNLENDNTKKTSLIYDLNDEDNKDDSAPAWIKAVRETAKELN